MGLESSATPQWAEALRRLLQTKVQVSSLPPAAERGGWDDLTPERRATLHVLMMNFLVRDRPSWKPALSELSLLRMVDLLGDAHTRAVKAQVAGTASTDEVDAARRVWLKAVALYDSVSGFADRPRGRPTLVH